MVPLFDGYQKVWVRGKLWIADWNFLRWLGLFLGLLAFWAFLGLLG